MGIKELIDLLRENNLTNAVRLGILLALYYSGGYVTFNDLRSSLEMPKSSLHKHLTALREQGLIEYKRGITVLGIRAVVKLTDKGDAVVRKYLELVSRLNHKA